MSKAKWETMRRSSGSIVQRTLVAEDGTEWAITKVRSTDKHSNGVEWWIHRNGIMVDYARKLANAQRKAEDFAAGRDVPAGEAQ